MLASPKTSVYVAFLRRDAQEATKDLLSRASNVGIALFGNGDFSSFPYVHVELVFHTRGCAWAEAFGISYGSRTPRVRKRTFDSGWDFVHLPMIRNVDRLYAKCKRVYPGTFSFATVVLAATGCEETRLPRRGDDEALLSTPKWYCSTLVAAVLRVHGPDVFEATIEVPPSPALLFEILTVSCKAPRRAPVFPKETTTAAPPPPPSLSSWWKLEGDLTSSTNRW